MTEEILPERHDGARYSEAIISQTQVANERDKSELFSPILPLIVLPSRLRASVRHTNSWTYCTKPEMTVLGLLYHVSGCEPSSRWGLDHMNVNKIKGTARNDNECVMTVVGRLWADNAKD